MPSVVFQSSARTQVVLTRRSKKNILMVFRIAIRSNEINNMTYIFIKRSLQAAYTPKRSLKTISAVPSAGLNNIIAKKWPRRVAFFFAKCLPNLFQLVRTVFRLFPNILTDENGRLGLRGQHNAVAGTGINLNHLRMDLVLGLQDNPGEVSVAAQRVNDHALHMDIEGRENVTDELVGQGTLVVLPAHGHRQGATHAGLHMDDKALFLVPNENGEGVLIRGEDAKNLHPHHIRIHHLEIPLRQREDNAVTSFHLFLIS